MMITALVAGLTWQAAFGQGKITEFKKIDRNTYLLWYDDYENKSVVAEFNSFLMLIEFPNNDSVSREVIQLLKVKFPSKPIKYVSHSHEHSHSSTTFDPFLAQTKAKLITTAHNYESIKSLTKDTADLKNRTILVDSTYLIKDNSNSVEIFILRQADYLTPTKEYIVFYLDKQHTLVSGCLYNKPISYHEIVTQRKNGIKKFITEHKRLNVEKLIPTNTTRKGNFEDICTMSMLDSTLIKGIKPETFVEKMQQKSIEYLYAKEDSLSEEYIKLSRSYDYIVCANYLLTYGDYLRSIAMLKSLAKAFPKDAIIHYFTGYAYEMLNHPTEAIAYYQRYLQMLTDPDTIKEMEERIAQLKKNL